LGQKGHHGWKNGIKLDNLTHRFFGFSTSSLEVADFQA
jgi:hypothetical protein